MINGTTLKNGTLRVILTGSDSIDEQVLKQLDGATCRFVTENLKLVDKNLSGALIIELQKDRADDKELREVESDIKTGV